MSLQAHPPSRGVLRLVYYDVNDENYSVNMLAQVVVKNIQIVCCSA